MVEEIVEMVDVVPSTESTSTEIIKSGGLLEGGASVSTIAGVAVPMATLTWVTILLLELAKNVTVRAVNHHKMKKELNRKIQEMSAQNVDNGDVETL